MNKLPKYYLSEANMFFVWETPEEIIMGVAERLTRIRKRRKITQQELSVKSNVSYGSIKRFETSGQISLISLTELCVALECTDEIKRLFTDVEYKNIEEVLCEQKTIKSRHINQQELDSDMDSIIKENLLVWKELAK